MKLGLVLAGGMAKGAYQAGALLELAKVLSPSDFSCISAASIGALNAYAFATGKERLAYMMWDCISCGCGLSGLRSALNRFQSEQLLEQLVSPNDTLPAPFYVPCLNWTAQKLDYINITPLSAASRAKVLSSAIAIPAFSAPVQIGEDNYYDGAIVDNVPVMALERQYPDKILLLHFADSSYFSRTGQTPELLELRFTDGRFLRQSFAFEHHAIHGMLRDGQNKVTMILKNSSGARTEKKDGKEAFLNGLESLPPPGIRALNGDQLVNLVNRALRRYRFASEVPL